MTETRAGPSSRTHSASQLWCCYSAIPFMVLFGVGWVLVARFLPPLDPGMPAAALADLFRAHGVRIRLGMMICMFSTLFLLPFSALVSAQIARIEGDGPRVWTYTSLMASAGNIIGFIFPLMFWNVAAFRVERAPELIMLLNDLAWLPFTGMAVPFIALPICVAIAGFIDSAATPVFPRWFCYYSIATTVVIMPAALVIFFQSGWFAWNNLFGWWLPLADFFMWLLVLFFLLRRGVLLQAGAAT